MTQKLGKALVVSMLLLVAFGSVSVSALPMEAHAAKDGEGYWGGGG